MKRLFTALLSIFCGLSLYSQSSNPVWLTSLEPLGRDYVTTTNDYRHETIMLGDVEYEEGFTVGAYSSLSVKKFGYIEYDLGGKYKTLTFIYGVDSGQPAQRKGIMVITADGQRIMDRIICTDDGNSEVTLDVEGVHILRFTVANTEVEYGVAMPALWKEGQTPRHMGRLTVAQPQPTMLCRDLMPAHLGHTVYSTNEEFHDRDLGYTEAEEGEIRLSGNVYRNGIYGNAQMALIGNHENYTTFNLGGLYEKMKFVVGAIDTDDGTIGRGWMTIYADRKIIYEKEVTEGKLAEEVTVDITGCHSLQFQTENAEWSLDIGIADIMVYPAGQFPEKADENDFSAEPVFNNDPVEKLAEAPAYLKGLPDQCKLVSNIPPYAIGGGMSRENAVFDDKSSFVTFSMGGTKFSEGIVMQSTTNFFHNNTGAHVMFNLGGEFDYLSFTTGWVGKCGVLKNDWLRVYADDELVLQVELIATSPNVSYLVPLYKCKVLKFEKLGMSSMSHPAFGLADMVVYRGEPKLDNGLFVHPKPECPDQIDLIDLNPPYIHYVSSAMDVKKLFDGTSKKEYFSMPGGGRIYKGFLLKTSVHFDIEMGSVSDPSAAIMAPAMGASIMIGSVGGATVAAVSPFGALLALAAGGTAHESSCAAFNTWGEYDMLTFTVACRLPHNTIDTIDLKGDPMETLRIGADGEIVAEFQIHDQMDPTTYTVPINRCHQLMFWLDCGGWSSGQFILYDLKLSRGSSGVTAPAPNINQRDNMPTILAPAEPYEITSTDIELTTTDMKWPLSYGSDAISDFKETMQECQKSMDRLIEEVNSTSYITVCRYVTDSNGNKWRSYRIQSPRGDKFTYPEILERNKQILRNAKVIKLNFAPLAVARTAATASLLEVDYRNIRDWKNALKQAGEMQKHYQNQINTLIKDKEKENEIIKALMKNATTVDGVSSTDYEIFTR